jgi:hypothetical protein
VANASRYDAIVATFVGILALVVSAYTAYIQKQQVRAQVLPILQFTSGFSDDDVHFDLSNKGMGPALIRDVHLSLHGKPVHNWWDLVERVYGSREFNGHMSSIGNEVLSPNETILTFKFLGLATPKDVTDKQALAKRRTDEIDKMRRTREEISVSICYCSTLDDCWMLRWGRDADGTAPIRRCPQHGDDSFD